MQPICVVAKQEAFLSLSIILNTLQCISVVYARAHDTITPKIKHAKDFWVKSSATKYCS